jgi:uncharacterized protein
MCTGETLVDNVVSFPDFKQLTLNDRDVMHPHIWAFQPQTSELTFGNLFIWRSYYNFEWSVLDECLVLLAHDREGATFALPPVGSGDRTDVTYRLLVWMRDELGVETPRISRASQRLVDDIGDDVRFTVTEARDHADYVYLTEALSRFVGRKYSAKRNHINQFMRYYDSEYVPITPDLVGDCLALAEVWCEQRLCDEDLSLQHELSGIQDMLDNFEALHADGGAILIQGKVQAFALGELLNESTAVIHIEKANPEFRGIYTKMTQAYAERWESTTTHINMEQDLGEPGLRRAKKSYLPDHLSGKFEVALA